MPSFDIVSQVDLHELTNAVDQTNREVKNRFDFKGTDAHAEQNGHEVVIVADAEFQVQQVLDILQNKMTRRGIDIDCLELAEVVVTINQARQKVTVRHGIDTETCKKIVKYIKQAKLKVQGQLQQDQVRVTGKNRDDLQAAIALVKDFGAGLPLQFINFRD